VVTLGLCSGLLVVPGFLCEFSIFGTMWGIGVVGVDGCVKVLGLGFLCAVVVMARRF